MLRTSSKIRSKAAGHDTVSSSLMVECARCPVSDRHAVTGSGLSVRETSVTSSAGTIVPAMNSDGWLADTRTSYDTVAVSYAQLARGTLLGKPYLRMALASFAVCRQRSRRGRWVGRRCRLRVRRHHRVATRTRCRCLRYRSLSRNDRCCSARAPEPKGPVTCSPLVIVTAATGSEPTAP